MNVKASLMRHFVAFVLLVVPCSFPWPASAAPDEKPHLARFYDDWLLAVDGLILDGERRAFHGLDDRQRELFIRAFWEVRGRERQQRFHDNLTEVRRRFKRLHGDRAQATLLVGVPSRVDDFGGCGRGARRLQVWTYTDWQARSVSGRDDEEGFVLVFYEPSVRRPGELRQWARTEPLSRLAYSRPGRGEPSLDDLLGSEIRDPCVPVSRSELRNVRLALQRAVSTVELRQRFAPARPEPAWVANLPGLLEGRLPAEPPAVADDQGGGGDVLSFEHPGRYRHSTVVRGRLKLPADLVERNDAGLIFDRLVLFGDVWQAGTFVEPFQVVYYIAGEAPAGGVLELDFYRALRPGAYTLDLRLADRSGLALLRRKVEVDVPRSTEAAPEPAGSRLGYGSLLRPEVGVLKTFPSVELAVDDGQVWAGDVEVAAVTHGGPIGRVDFLLDGETVGADAAPPWAASLALPEDPRRCALEAVAFDPDGRELSRDRKELNASPPRFAVRILEPRRGADLDGASVRARVDLPAGETLAAVELYAGDTLLATLREPPFAHPLPPFNGKPAGHYARVLARLESGAETEDLVFLGEQPFDEVDVDLVELYTSVTDADGRPRLGLTAGDFRVYEDDEPRQVVRFDTLENLPIHVTLLMDVSQSMRRRMEIATISALRFFENVVTPKDAASVLVFNHDIRRLVPFTADVDRLRDGAAGLTAFGSTRLHDAVVYALHGFGGREGKKALVLLSDGEDVDSDFYFPQVLQEALRSGVAVYPISLGSDRDVVRADGEPDPTRENLRRLARETGGRFFEIRLPSELDRVYRQIEQDLRSQYLLVYRPPAGKGRTEFRQVRLEVAEGLRARTIYGYYP